MMNDALELRFAWRGMDSEGQPMRGKIIAADALAARASLRREGVIVTLLETLGAAPPPKARTADVTVFTRQLAGLLRAGLPLVGALELLAGSASASGMPRIVRALARDITRGVPFSGARWHGIRLRSARCTASWFRSVKSRVRCRRCSPASPTTASGRRRNGPDCAPRSPIP